jgi:hypothetical protein
MQPSQYMYVSDHSPSIGPIQELIHNPDTRSSHQVEIDERRWHDKALHRRINDLTVEVGRVSDFIFLIAEKQDQLARDLQAERIARMEADAQNLALAEKYKGEMERYIEAADLHRDMARLRIAELEGVVAALSERTWWSMFKDLFKRKS